MKYGPGERAVPTSIHLVSIFSPPSVAEAVGIPFLDLWEGGVGCAEQHKGQVYLFEGACLCVHRDSQALVMIKNL